MLIGSDFTSWLLEESPINESAISNVAVMNCEVDDLFITTDSTVVPSGDYSTEWNGYTVLHGAYNGGINAGNIELAIATVDSIRLKKRKRGTYKWITLFEQQISDETDFNFVYFDRTCRANTEYEYALIAVSGNVEGNLRVNRIVSDFDGAFICDKEKGYHALYNLEFEYSPNRESNTIFTPGRKHPFVVSNGMSNAYSGTLSATFVQSTTDQSMEIFEDGWRHRMEVIEFLNDGNPKIIKNWEGKMFLAAITRVEDDQSGHRLNPIQRVSFVEIGDCESVGDLYDNGLIDSDFDR